MTKDEVLQGNKLIAEFMGYKQYNGYNDYFQHGDYAIPERKYYTYSPQQEENVETDSYSLNALEFDSSWDWLMLVVEKIESLVYTINMTSSPTISGRWYMYTIEFYNYGKMLDKISIVKISSDYDNKESRISTYYRGVIEFIKWYNQQTK